MTTSLLVCAAIEEELAPLRELVASGRTDGIRMAPLGIGPVEAALGAFRLLASRPEAAIFVGTCGAFPGTGLSIGEAVVVERTLLTASDVAAGLSYLPAPARRIARADPRLCRELTRNGIPLVGGATTVAITRDGDRAAALRDATDCQVEHLEAHAFLRAAEEAGVPAACVLGVANQVGPDAHQEWKTNADRASAAAARVIRSWLAER